MMLGKKELNVEEEKHHSGHTHRPQEMGFRPYHIVKLESQEGHETIGQFTSSGHSSNWDPKKTRKRRRLSCERDLSPETFRKTRNKRLAKESRNRKFNYIKSLEDKITELENKVVMLNEKLETYQKKIAHLEIKDTRGHENLGSAQDYWHNQVSEALKGKSTSKEHLKDIVDYFVATLGVAGSDRKRVIKNAIKVLLDNLVPESWKVLLFINKHQIKASDKQLETLRTSSKYKFDELMREHDFGIVEEILTKVDVQKHQRPIVKDYWAKLTGVRRLYREIVHDIWKLPTKIYEAMTKFNEVNREFTKQFDLTQMGKFIECSRTFRCKYQIDIFTTFDAKRVRAYENW